MGPTQQQRLKELQERLEELADSTIDIPGDVNPGAVGAAAAVAAAAGVVAMPASPILQVSRPYNAMRCVCSSVRCRGGACYEPLFLLVSLSMPLLFLHLLLLLMAIALSLLQLLQPLQEEGCWKRRKGRRKGRRRQLLLLLLLLQASVLLGHKGH
jgi:hypothetical protein